ncbi:hypothetical protein [Nocardia sp. NPDC002869]|uniref:hypothetical protein n=1 Tax=Nocardia sp. NPDC002869 TaxID=3161032 RepID=UPI00398CC57A
MQSGFRPHRSQVGFDRTAGSEHGRGVQQRPGQDHRKADDSPLLQLEIVCRLIQLRGQRVVGFGLVAIISSHPFVVGFYRVTGATVDVSVPLCRLGLYVLRLFGTGFGPFRIGFGHSTHGVFVGERKVSHHDIHHHGRQP